MTRKPGALPGATALEQARAAGAFTSAHEAWWAAACKAHGDAAGTRALIEVLLLHRHLRAEHVVDGIQAALQAGKENVEKARKGIAGGDNEVLKQIEAGGVKVTSLSDAQRDAFVKATRPVYEKWAKQIGEPLVKKAEAAIAKR